MRSRFKKAAALMTMALFFLSSSVSAATLEGQIVSLEPQSGGLWEVAVKSSEGVTTFVLSSQTLIQKEVPVEMLKTGDRLVSRRSGSGTKGFKAPFGNMSASTKKALGLPNVPSVPQIPKIPQIPDKQQMQGSPASKGGGGSAAPGPGAASGGGGMAPPKKPVEEPKVQTQAEMLEEKGFQNEKLLFPPKEGSGSPGEEVTQINQTDLGFEVTVVSETGEPAKQTYTPGKKVLKVLSIKEVQKNDKVLLNFNDQDRTVSELQVNS